MKIIDNIFYNFFIYIKMVKRYCQKKKLRKEARERYESLSKKEKEKRREKVRDRYQNLSEKEKEKNASESS